MVMNDFELHADAKKVDLLFNFDEEDSYIFMDKLDREILQQRITKPYGGTMPGVNAVDLSWLLNILGRIVMSAKPIGLSISYPIDTGTDPNTRICLDYQDENGDWYRLTFSSPQIENCLD